MIKYVATGVVKVVRVKIAVIACPLSRGVLYMKQGRVKVRGGSVIGLGLPYSRTGDLKDHGIAARPPASIDNLLDYRGQVRALIGYVIYPGDIDFPVYRGGGIRPAGYIVINAHSECWCIVSRLPMNRERGGLGVISINRRRGFKRDIRAGDGRSLMDA